MIATIDSQNSCTTCVNHWHHHEKSIKFNKNQTGKGHRAPCAGGENQTSSIRRADCWAGAWGCFYRTSRAAGSKWAAVPDPPKCYTIEEAPVERKAGRWVSSAR